MPKLAVGFARVGCLLLGGGKKEQGARRLLVWAGCNVARRLGVGGDIVKIGLSGTCALRTALLCGRCVTGRSPL